LKFEKRSRKPILKGMVVVTWIPLHILPFEYKNKTNIYPKNTFVEVKFIPRA
jgi:hypothetical protein